MSSCRFLQYHLIFIIDHTDSYKTHVRHEYSLRCRNGGKKATTILFRMTLTWDLVDLAFILALVGVGWMPHVQTGAAAVLNLQLSISMLLYWLQRRLCSLKDWNYCAYRVSIVYIYGLTTNDGLKILCKISFQYALIAKMPALRYSQHIIVISDNVHW